MSRAVGETGVRTSGVVEGEVAPDASLPASGDHFTRSPVGAFNSRYGLLPIASAFQIGESLVAVSSYGSGPSADRLGGLIVLRGLSFVRTRRTLWLILSRARSPSLRVTKQVVAADAYVWTSARRKRCR